MQTIYWQIWSKGFIMVEDGKPIIIKGVIKKLE
jgi:hypothetical protein